MKNQQGAPEALRLADAIDPFERKSAPDHLTSKVAADELRRLHAEKERLAALVDAQQPAPSAAEPSCDALTDFQEGQWWVNELDAVASHPLGARIYVTADMKRAVAVVHHLLRSARKHEQPSPTPQADSQPAQQPNTAYAALPAECDSPELCAVSRSCAGQFGTKRICASRGQAPAQAASDERDDFEKVFPLPSGCIRVGTGYASTGYSNWAAHTHCERWQGWQARAARAQADIGAAPAAGAVAGWQWVPVEPTHEMLAAAAIMRWRYDALLAAAPPPPAQAADSMLEDAARYRHIRDVPHSEEVRSVLSLQQNAVMDKVIDKDRAAMAAKKGDAHE